ncbi:26S proteasome non-ATPase regulatory subunit 6 [Dichanthelium oligosanthes]|uniref:26S proteasome regulatory subunit RPN7 n=1 Tax=Dichanthelium oligosanthes TaxID=888268 RepID=A0A1E5VNL5_9POAL|nr:26S proteasome non-ATPase regulatory subunit 6 [Dichanthelium oligosanthes]
MHELYAVDTRVQPAAPLPARSAPSHDDGAAAALDAYDSDMDASLRATESDPRERPSPGFLDAARGGRVGPTERAALVAWMSDFARHFDIGPAALHRAVSYADRFLSAKGVAPGFGIDYPLRLLDVAAVYAAAKHEDSTTARRVNARDIAACCGFAASREVLDTELVLLSALGYRLGGPTAHTYVEHFTRHGGRRGEEDILELRRTAHLIADTSLVDHRCLRLLPLAVAAAAILLARLFLTPSRDREQVRRASRELEEMTGYKPMDMYGGMDCMYRMMPGDTGVPESKQADAVAPAVIQRSASCVRVTSSSGCATSPGTLSSTPPRSTGPSRTPTASFLCPLALGLCLLFAASVYAAASSIRPEHPTLRATEAKPAERNGRRDPRAASEMDGGAGEDGKQERHLVLAHKLFLLSHTSVDDLSKVALRAEVLDAVKSDDMAPLFESLVSAGVLEPDAALLAEMRGRIDEEIRKFDEKIADAEENLGESEVREAHLAKSLYFIRVGEKEKALEQLKVTEGNTVAVGQKMDLVFHTLQIGFFYMDFDLISKSIDKAKNLFEEGGDWERKNRLKVYEGLYCMATRNFKKAASLFLDSISTFTTYELFPYDTFIFYTVLTSIITLDRVSLKQKVVDAPEILAVIGKVPHLSEFLNSLYKCQYKSFFVAFSGLTEQIKLDRYLQPHFRYYMREVRTVVYSQFLESYKSVTMEAMAAAFGVTVDFIDQELSRFIAAGKLHCKIDKVAGVLETNRPDERNAFYQATIKQGDFLLNRIQKLSRVIDL